MVQKSPSQPPDMYGTLWIMGYLPYELVQDFFHQQYSPAHKYPEIFSHFVGGFRDSEYSGILGFQDSIFWVTSQKFHPRYVNFNYVWYLQYCFWMTQVGRYSGVKKKRFSNTKKYNGSQRPPFKKCWAPGIPHDSSDVLVPSVSSTAAKGEGLCLSLKWYGCFQK